MKTMKLETSEIRPGDVLLRILGQDRMVTGLGSWRKPWADLPPCRSLNYRPGPTRGITAFEGELWEIRRGGDA